MMNNVYRANQLLTTPYLTHYCRVCNIQLNSCRQAKIHSEGQKHSKRLNFLKLCIEAGEWSRVYFVSAIWNQIK